MEADTWSDRCGACKRCRDGHGDVEGFTCAAFPDGIPKEILTGEHDHSEPYQGDKGVRKEDWEFEDRGFVDKRAPPLSSK